jgi:hypothetical protein
LSTIRDPVSFPIQEENLTQRRKKYKWAPFVFD